MAVQIWLVFAGITLLFALILMGLIFVTLQSYFTEKIYQDIESAQEAGFHREAMEQNPFERDQSRQTIRTVNNIVIRSDGRLMNRPSLPQPFIQHLIGEARSQTNEKQRYTKGIEGEKIYYVIRKGEWQGKSFYLISYMWDSYLHELVRNLFIRLIVIVGIGLLLIWIPTMVLARYLSRPLRQMERHVDKIANKEWHQEITTDRTDEIGRLYQSIEKMRAKLEKQDQAQQSLLQNVSHELKTPIMVIRSYAESIRDGIFPKKDMAGSVQVIQDESLRLEKKVQDLLYLTKLDYYATREPSFHSVALSALLEEVVERFRYQRQELSFDLQLCEAVIQGDGEQWKIAFENLLDNQVRYAGSQIRIEMKLIENRGVVQILIWNDGPEIEAELLPDLFTPYHRGKKGKFGLGLAIVHRVVALHQAEMTVKNEAGGVGFYIDIPYVTSNSATTG